MNMSYYGPSKGKPTTTTVGCCRGVPEHTEEKGCILSIHTWPRAP